MYERKLSKRLKKVQLDMQLIDISFEDSRLRIWFENIDVKMETLELKIAKS